MDIQTIGSIVAWICTLGAFGISLFNYRALKNKTKAETETALGGALEDAGTTLQGAWKQISELQNRDRERENEMRDIRREMRRLRRELDDWRNHAARLTKQLIEEAHLTPVSFEMTPDTEDIIVVKKK